MSQQPEKQVPNTEQAKIEGKLNEENKKDNDSKPVSENKKNNKDDKNNNEKKNDNKTATKKTRRSFLGGKNKSVNHDNTNRQEKSEKRKPVLTVSKPEQTTENRDLDKEEIAKRIAESGRQTVVKSYLSFEVAFLKAIKFISSRLDATIKSPRNSKILSLSLAILLYAALGTGMLPKIFVSQQSGDVVDGVPVHVNYSAQRYEIEGVPEAVSVSFVGDRFNLQTTLSQQIYRVYADLTKYGVGTHNVNLEVENVGNNVKASVSPSTITVTIREKLSYQRTFDYEFINKSKIDARFILSTPTFDRSDILVMVSEEREQQIASIKAQIDVQEITSEGRYSLITTIKAFDVNGQEIEATFAPATVIATVDVTAPSKIVPIVIVPIGELPDSTKAIGEISLSHDTVTIFGPEAELNKINELRVEFDISTLTGTSQSYAVPIIYPNGVTKADVPGNKVNLLITVVEKTSKVFNDIPVRFINNVSNLKPTATAENRGRVNVRVYGSAKRLEALSENDISVFIDLGNITAVGEYDVLLNVALPDLTLTPELIGGDTIHITMSN